MADSIISLLVKSLQAAQTWFTQILDKTGLAGLFLGMFAIYLAVKFLIYPLFGGSAGSDRVGKPRDREGT